MPPLETPGELTALALRYAAGELPREGRREFDRRLATDASAREALAEAVRLSAAIAGAAPPHPGIVGAVRDRLLPTVWARLFPVRYSRGHPVLWLAGGAIAAGAALFAFDQPNSAAVGLPTTNAIRIPPAADAVHSPAPTTGEPTLPVAGMEPDATVPQPMPQPRVEMPPEAGEPKKG